MNYKKFRNLAIHGVHFTTVQNKDSWETLTEDNPLLILMHNKTSWKRIKVRHGNVV